MPYYDKDRTIDELLAELKERIDWEKDGDTPSELAWSVASLCGLTNNRDELAEQYPIVNVIYDEAAGMDFNNDTEPSKAAAWGQIKHMVSDLEDQVKGAMAQ